MGGVWPIEFFGQEFQIAVLDGSGFLWNDEALHYSARGRRSEAEAIDHGSTLKIISEIQSAADNCRKNLQPGDAEYEEAPWDRGSYTSTEHSKHSDIQNPAVGHRRAAPVRFSCIRA
jgi:hypothetical protein